MYVCGQASLLQRIDNLIEKGALPGFIIIVGGRGCGKKVLCDYIARKLEANFVPCGNKIDDIREVIQNAYTMTEKTLYMIFDCDDMSSAAKNSLLKVTEEPPNNAYFAMTVQDPSSILGTISSRGTIFYTEPYSYKDLSDFISYKGYEFDKDTLDIVMSICTCPEDITVASGTNIKEVYDMAEKFIQFVGAANLANELKITTLLSTKKEDGKIDPVIFLRCIMLCCERNMKQNITKEDAEIFKTIIENTSKCLTDINSKGSSKQIVLDNWIINTHMGITGGKF